MNNKSELFNGLLLAVCVGLVIAIGAKRDDANKDPYVADGDIDSVDQNSAILAGSTVVLIVSILITLSKIFLVTPQDARFTFFYMILLIELFVFLSNSMEAHVQFNSKNTNWQWVLGAYDINKTAYELNTILLLCSITNMFSVLINILMGVIAGR